MLNLNNCEKRSALLVEKRTIYFVVPHPLQHEIINFYLYDNIFRRRFGSPVAHAST